MATTPSSPADDDRALRDAVIDTARRMNALGINRGKAGNVSARVQESAAFIVTPSALPYEETAADDLVRVEPGDRFVGSRSPSSEWRFHRDIYRERSDVRAIVHTHAPFATTLACLERGIPPFHYMVAVAGGADIRCAPYATFGTQALSDRVVEALDGRRACLLAHHGMIAVGSTLHDALDLAQEVETLAELYWRALQVETPRLLSDAEMSDVLERFASYGRAGR